MKTWEDIKARWLTPEQRGRVEARVRVEKLRMALVQCIGALRAARAGTLMCPWCEAIGGCIRDCPGAEAIRAAEEAIK